MNLPSESAAISESIIDGSSEALRTWVLVCVLSVHPYIG